MYSCILQYRIINHDKFMKAIQFLNSGKVKGIGNKDDSCKQYTRENERKARRTFLQEYKKLINNDFFGNILNKFGHFIQT